MKTRDTIYLIYQTYAILSWLYLASKCGMYPIYSLFAASKQMVYKVYENVIGALEEIETRESKTRKHKPLPRSKIQYADQSLRKDFDVSTIKVCNQGMT